jgi:hypothetical protein
VGPIASASSSAAAWSGSVVTDIEARDYVGREAVLSTGRFDDPAVVTDRHAPDELPARMRR